MNYFLHVFTLLLGLTFSTNAYNQVTISDVTLPATMDARGTNLQLNGGGLREKFWIDLYVGGLYLESKTSKSETVINSNAPMAIRLEIVSSRINSENMTEAVDEGFEKSTKGNKKAHQAGINQFKKALSEPIVEGDVFELIYTPEKGTQVFKNGNFKQTIPGLKFKQALFGIWFCEEPADEALKTGMLGL